MADWVLLACLNAYWNDLSSLHLILVGGGNDLKSDPEKIDDYHAIGSPPCHGLGESTLLIIPSGCADQSPT